MTLQQSAPEIPPIPGRGASGGVPGIPAPPPPRSIPRVVMILWLVVIGMAVFFLPLYLVALTIREDAKTMETEIASIRVSLTNVPTPPPEIANQMTPLAQAQRQIVQLYQIYPTLAAPHADLAAVMTAINNYSPYEIMLTEVTLAAERNRMTLMGRASRDEVVLTYVHNLEQSGLFTRVTLQSAQVIATITPTLTLTPTATALPTASPTIAIPTITLAPTITPIPSTNTPPPTATSTPTLTPSATPTVTPTGTATSTSTPSMTPDLRDVYEPDDPDPKPIAVGETQQHNFFPGGDMDNIFFPAKAQRYYQVLTSELALGVDTVVTVTLNGNVLAYNDDYAPGTGNFASAVCFQSPQDGSAVAKITNKGGFYAPDKTYKVKVSEISGLNTPPCPSVTSTPAAMQMPRLALISAPPFGSPLGEQGSRGAGDASAIAQQRSGKEMASQNAMASRAIRAYILDRANPRARFAPMPYRFAITLDLKAMTP